MNIIVNYRDEKFLVLNDLGILVYGKWSAPSGTWFRIPDDDPLLKLCQIWRATFAASLSLQEYLDGAA